MRLGLVLGAALAAGVYLEGADARTDDGGVIAGLVALASLALSLYLPSHDWLVALLVAGPISVHGLATGNPGALLALAFAFGGAGVARGARALGVRAP